MLTNADGGYLFEFVPPGTYRVRVTPPDGTVQTADPDATFDNETTVTVIAGQVHDTADFGYTSPAITGYVFDDTNGNGVPTAANRGWQVSI